MRRIDTYSSAWDWLPWSVIILTVAVCLVSAAHVNVLLAVIMALFFAAVEVAAFLSTYYEIEGDELVVHSSFKVIRYPVDCIRMIERTDSWLAAPAASLTRRIAITFTDRRIMRGSIPLIISPARQSDFIRQLLSINPGIDNRVPL